MQPRGRLLGEHAPVAGGAAAGDFSASAKQQAIGDLLAAADDGALHVRTATAFPLAQIAKAHEAVERGAHDGRVLIAPSR